MQIEVYSRTDYNTVFKETLLSTQLNLPPIDAAYWTKLVNFDMQHKLKYSAEQTTFINKSQIEVYSQTSNLTVFKERLLLT
jgi:hypothetical protein